MEKTKIKQSSVYDFDDMVSMMDAIMESELLIAPDGTIITVNNVAAKRLGTAKNKLIGRCVYDLPPKGLWEARKKYIEKAMHSRKMVMFEDKRNDYYFRHTVLPLVTKQGAIKAVAIFKNDISKQKTLEKRMDDTEVFYQTILENISDAVFLTDNNGKITFICKNVHYIFGYSAAQLVKKKNIYQLIKGLSAERENIVSGKEINNLECSITTRQGQICYLLISVKSVTINNATDSLFVCRDITQLKNAQISLENKNIALAEIIASVQREKKQLEQTIAQKVNKLVSPLIKMVEERPACSDLAGILRSSVRFLTSSEGRTESLADYNLSPREIQICNMVKVGMSMKEVAEMLNTSPLTVEKQRKNVRKKLGIADGTTNLATYLKKLDT